MMMRLKMHNIIVMLLTWSYSRFVSFRIIASILLMNFTLILSAVLNLVKGRLDEFALRLVVMQNPRSRPSLSPFTTSVMDLRNSSSSFLTVKRKHLENLETFGMSYLLTMVSLIFTGSVFCVNKWLQGALKSLREIIRVSLKRMVQARRFAESGTGHRGHRKSFWTTLSTLKK